MPPTGMIDFQVIGDDKGVQRMLSRLDTALSAPAIAAMLTTGVEPWIKKRAEQRFASEGDDVSGKWAPLSSETERIRSSQGFSPAHPINVRTHELEDYITQSSARVNIFTAGATLSYPGTPSRKASVRAKMLTAQKGKARPRTPARPVIGLSHKDLEFVLLAMAHHVKGSPVPLP